MRRAPVALAAVLLAHPAAAEEVALPNTRAVLRIPAGWTRVEDPGLVAGYRSGGAFAAVTRAAVPNPDAWRAKTREAYADQIERGLVAAARGRRIARKVAEVAGIPALDLEVRRDGGAVLVVRVLLYRTYALSLAIEVPAGASAVEARAIAAQFAPPSQP